MGGLSDGGEGEGAECGVKWAAGRGEEGVGGGRGVKWGHFLRSPGRAHRGGFSHGWPDVSSSSTGSGQRFSK